MRCAPRPAYAGVTARAPPKPQTPRAAPLRVRPDTLAPSTTATPPPPPPPTMQPPSTLRHLHPDTAVYAVHLYGDRLGRNSHAHTHTHTRVHTHKHDDTARRHNRAFGDHKGLDARYRPPTTPSAYGPAERKISSRLAVNPSPAPSTNRPGNRARARIRRGMGVRHPEFGFKGRAGSENSLDLCTYTGPKKQKHNFASCVPNFVIVYDPFPSRNFHNTFTQSQMLSAD